MTEIVTQLPATGEFGKIYLLPKTDPEQGDMYDEYLWVGISSTHPNGYEKLGTKPEGFTLPTDVIYLNSSSTASTADGGFDTPYKSFSQVVDYFNNLPEDVELTVYILPGNYPVTAGQSFVFEGHDKNVTFKALFSGDVNIYNEEGRSGNASISILNGCTVKFAGNIHIHDFNWLVNDGGGSDPRQATAIFADGVEVDSFTGYGILKAMVIGDQGRVEATDCLMPITKFEGSSESQKEVYYTRCEVIGYAGAIEVRKNAYVVLDDCKILSFLDIYQGNVECKGYCEFKRGIVICPAETGQSAYLSIEDGNLYDASVYIAPANGADVCYDLGRLKHSPEKILIEGQVENVHRQFNISTISSSQVVDKNIRQYINPVERPDDYESEEYYKTLKTWLDAIDNAFGERIMDVPEQMQPEMPYVRINGKWLKLSLGNGLSGEITNSGEFKISLN